MRGYRLVYVHDDGSKDVIEHLTTNRNLSVRDVLDMLEIDMDKYAQEHGWDDWDFSALKLETF